MPFKNGVGTWTTFANGTMLPVNVKILAVPLTTIPTATTAMLLRRKRRQN